MKPSNNIVRAMAARDMLLRMVANFPGLYDCETPVDGADLTDWITAEVCAMKPDTDLDSHAREGSPVEEEEVKPLRDDDNKHNTRYLAYCRVHGMSPDAMEVAERIKYCGRTMTGFLCWINKQWARWAEARGRYACERTATDHADFDEWLAEQVLEEKKTV